MAKVLVIGGGVAGCAAVVGIRKFDKDVEIVMVEPKDHCEVYWAAYRSPFDETVADNSLYLLEKWAEKNNVQHIRSVVKKLTATEATLANNDTIAFDVCVISTGSGAKAKFLGRGLPATDGTKATRLQELKAAGERMLNASKVAICGGGLIGIELAGDLAYFAKEQGKSVAVTLVHSGPFLSHHEVSEKAGEMMKTKLEKLGVTVILNDKAIEGEGGGKMTLESSGEALEADEVIMTTGFLPVNDFVKEGFGASITEKGWVNADEFHRLKGETKIFAYGDCSTALPCAGNQYMNGRATLGKNIKTTLDAIRSGSDFNSLTLQKLKPGPVAFVNTIGKKDGVAAFGTGFYTQYILPTIKNKTMFLFAAKNELGLLND